MRTLLLNDFPGSTVEEFPFPTASRTTNDLVSEGFESKVLQKQSSRQPYLTTAST